jgi:23S rRNA (cytosine1962-C5)-methyltransferase
MQRESTAAGEPYTVLKLKHREEQRILAGHLWVFSNEIDTLATPLANVTPGATVQLRSSRDRFLGWAYANPHSLITARILSRDPAQPPDRALIVARLRAALALRERLYPAPYYRLCYGESDGLPGLVVDRYGEYLVVQLATAGMEARRALLLEALQEACSPQGVLLKNDGSARELEGLPRYVETVAGHVPAEVELVEGGLAFTVPLAQGQKTGWYYDQTANRDQFLRYAAGARRILDVFGYAGAWGIRAAAGTGAELTVIDASAAALAHAGRNAGRHGVALTALRGDAFDVLAELIAAQERFDLVVVDPPAFIKRRKDIPRGQAAYRRLNQQAMGVLTRDGLLVSCSCSYHLEASALEGALQKAAQQRARSVQILLSGGQSPDHPVHPAIPETRYLKAFLCRCVAN